MLRSEDTRRRMKEAAERRWARPGERERMRDVLKSAAMRPEVRERSSELRKQEWANPEIREKRLVKPKEPKVEIPKWVPAKFHGTYRETTARSGEEAAASLVRRLKREAEKGASV